jgi:hypothetical protein
MHSQNDKLADSSQPVILRIASASYLASFLVCFVQLELRRSVAYHWHTGSLIVLVAGVCAAVLGGVEPLVRCACANELGNA